MLLKKWLTVSSRGAARLTASRPSLGADEISMCLKIELPDALFKKPSLMATITIPEEACAGSIIDTVVCDNIKDVIEKATGLEFSISVANTDTPEE